MYIIYNIIYIYTYPIFWVPKFKPQFSEIAIEMILQVPAGPWWLLHGDTRHCYQGATATGMVSLGKPQFGMIMR